ncbi:hypothetical protein BYT27DRAFT_6773843 [Phlegmacium glaucopus]|nr:hypothetical protein BYT27DRAFT_6773843 [Phlegmacium glaucopus]
MGQKRKASKAHIGNLQVARGSLPDKRWKSTPAESDLSDGRTSDDEIVHLNSFKTHQNCYIISQMDSRSDEDIPKAIAWVVRQLLLLFDIPREIPHDQAFR